MIETTQTPTGHIKLTATAGVIHKKDTDTYASSIIMLPGETPAMYEEVAERPAYTRAEYDARVAALIHERYSADEETSLINNMLEDNPTDEHRAEYAAYQAYRAACKQRAKDPALYSDPDHI